MGIQPSSSIVTSIRSPLLERFDIFRILDSPKRSLSRKSGQPFLDFLSCLGIMVEKILQSTVLLYLVAMVAGRNHVEPAVRPA